MHRELTKISPSPKIRWNSVIPLKFQVRGTRGGGVSKGCDGQWRIFPVGALLRHKQTTPPIGVSATWGWIIFRAGIVIWRFFRLFSCYLPAEQYFGRSVLQIAGKRSWLIWILSLIKPRCILLNIIVVENLFTVISMVPKWLLSAKTVAERNSTGGATELFIIAYFQFGVGRSDLWSHWVQRKINFSTILHWYTVFTIESGSNENYWIFIHLFIEIEGHTQTVVHNSIHKLFDIISLLIIEYIKFI